MKQSIIFGLILVSVFLGGCGGENSEKVATNAEQSSMASSSLKENASGTESVATTSTGKPDESVQSQAQNESDVTEANGDANNANESGEKKHPTSNENQSTVPSPTNPIPPDPTHTSGSGEVPGGQSHIEQPQSHEDVFFSDKRTLIMIGIIVALCGIVGYLLYERNKKMGQITTTIAKPVDESLTSLNDTQENVIRQNKNVEKTLLRVGTLKNIGQRSEQQDSSFIASINDDCTIQEKGMLAVVADGMGGLQGGATISGLVTGTFAKCYAQATKMDDPKMFLYNSAALAENAVEEYINQSGINGGSTVVAVLIQGNRLNYISVGDSHIYSFFNGNLELINKEHSFAEVLKEKAARGEVDPREPYVNPQRNSLTAYIGMGSFQVVDNNEHPIILARGTKILLCSDGVYNALGDDALINALSAGDALSCARKLEADILSQHIPNQDNFTGIVLEYLS